MMKRASAAEEYTKNAEDLKREQVEDLENWCKQQPHLPEISEVEVIIFLHSNYYDMEATKKTIENYFTMRTSFTEFFNRRDVTTDELQEAVRVM